LKSTERVQKSVPLSTAQEGIWLAQMQDTASPAFNIAEYVEIQGPIDTILFETALRQIVAETEALQVRVVEHKKVRGSFLS